MSPSVKSPSSQEPNSQKPNSQQPNSQRRRANSPTETRTRPGKSARRLAKAPAQVTGTPASRGGGRQTRGLRGRLRGALEERLPERIGWWVAVAALLLPPLVLLGGLRDPFRLPKALLTELLVPVSLVFLAFALRRVERIDWRRLAMLPAVRALLPFWLVAAVSTLLTAHPEHAREALWSLSLGMLAVCAWSLSLPRKRRVLDLLLIPAVVLAVVAILQHHEIFRPFELLRGGGRIQMTSLAGNVADLGAYLVLPLLVAQAGIPRALAARRPLVVVGAVAICLVLLYTMLIGQTLSALAALFVSSALFWLLRAPVRLRLPMVGGAIALGVLGLLLVAPARERVERKLDELRAGQINDVLTGRLDGWRAGADMLVRHPLFGVGPGGYRAEFSTTKLAMIDDGATFWWGHTDGSLFANAHNEPIEVGAELGVLGLVTLGWCAWVLLGELRRRPVPPTDDPVDDDRRALQWAGLAALAVLSATYFPLRTALVAYPNVLLLAWMLEPRGVLAEDDGAAAAAARLAEPKEVAA